MLGARAFLSNDALEEMLLLMLDRMSKQEALMTMVDFDALSTAERILKLQDLWDEIAESPESIELTAEQRETLDHRLDRVAQNPGDTIPWQERRLNTQKA